MKVTVNESTLTNIADAIREKEGSGNVYYPSEMGEAIRNLPSGGNEPTDEELTYSGDCSYAFKNQSWLIDKYGDRITTNGIITALCMFSGCDVSVIPFELNFMSSSYGGNSLERMFMDSNIITPPKINGAKPDTFSNLFCGCKKLLYIPEDFGEDFDWSKVDGATSAYSCYGNGMLDFCHCLRNFPIHLFTHGNPTIAPMYSHYYRGFTNCYCLDEIVGLPIPHTKSTWTSNAFYYTFSECSRLKNLTFALNNGEPYVVNWKNQDIDLLTVGYFVGYLPDGSDISGDEAVVDDETYQAYKNSPDWCAENIAYSRYNHDSAVATINSLPDASAYLASAGGTNTIRFNRRMGMYTDGGAINTLTEEEIAVATAKGWTVTLV